MTITSYNIMRQCTTVCFFVGSVLLSGAAQAQLSAKREQYDSIAARYKNDHAVYTNYVHKLVITEEGGSMVANSYVTMEKVITTDIALNRENNDLFAYSDFHELTNLSGVAYLPTKYDYKRMDNAGFGQGGLGDDVFYDDVRIVEAYYTGLKKNAITETKYTLQHTDLNMLPRFYFFEDIPILNASFEVTTPLYVKMNFVLMGLDTNRIKRTEEEKNGTITYKFTATDIPAYKSYGHVPSFSYYIPHVVPYIVSYRLTGASTDSLLSSSTEELHKYDHKFARNFNLHTDTAINKIVADITRNDVTDRQKAAHIYNWIQNNIHYIAFEAGLQGFVPRAADTVFKRKYGDCKDMASLSMAMCRRAGLKAYFATIGTTDIPYHVDELPLPALFNHEICAVQLGDEWAFIDGTHMELPFGANRHDVQGKEALVNIDDSHYKVVTIPVESADKNTVSDVTDLKIDYNNVTGTLSTYYTGYGAWDTRHALRYLKNEELERAIRSLTSRGSDRYVQKKFAVAKGDKNSKDLGISADFEIDGYVHQVGKEYYVNMNLDRYFSNERINDTARKVAWYFPYKTKTKETVILHIPDGYNVTYLPKEVHGENGILNYKISYAEDKKERTVTLVKEYELKTLSVSLNKFADLNKLVDNLRNLYKESVVLTASKKLAAKR